MTGERHGHGSERLDEAKRVVMSVTGGSREWANSEVREQTAEYGGNGDGDEMSVEEKHILSIIVTPSPELPFPLRELKMSRGRPALEYVIPEEERERVFQELYPFMDPPGMDEERYDLHEGRSFRIREYKVIREDGRNLLVSPYYANSGVYGKNVRDNI